MQCTARKLPKHLDPVERLRTAQHEMSHAIVSYALECTEIKVTVLKKPKNSRLRPGLNSIGLCGQVFKKVQYKLFVTCGPFVSTAYAVDSSDELEFKDMVNDFIRTTGKSAASFRYSVFDPVKNLLDSEPVVKIITRLAVPLAQGGILYCKKHTDMEKFFPKDMSWPLLLALCRSVKEAADELPLRKR
jgi:hypothetical protein